MGNAFRVDPPGIPFRSDIIWRKTDKDKDTSVAHPMKQVRMSYVRQNAVHSGYVNPTTGTEIHQAFEADFAQHGVNGSWSSVRWGFSRVSEFRYSPQSTFLCDPGEYYLPTLTHLSF